MYYTGRFKSYLNYSKLRHIHLCFNKGCLNEVVVQKGCAIFSEIFSSEEGVCKWSLCFSSKVLTRILSVSLMLLYIAEFSRALST